MGERVSWWTRFTHAVNVLVWRLPLERRLLVRLSGLVYRSPPLLGRHVVEVLDALENAGVIAACAGGWGIDALAGKQIRIHRDLDAIIATRDLDKATAALAELGYEEWYRLTDAGTFGVEGPQITASVIFRDKRFLVVDLILFDDPHDIFTYVRGSISGHPVTCLSPQDQITSHRGLTLSRYRKDRQLLYGLIESPAVLREAEKKPGDVS